MVVQMRRAGVAGLLALGLLAGAVPARAADPTAMPSGAQAEIDAAAEAMNKARLDGPRDIPLAGQGVFHLPAGMAFVPAAEAGRYMIAVGNGPDPRRIGLVFPLDKDSPWLVDLEWVSEGHVPDGDADDWKPDAMLQGLKEGTEEQNKDRIARGIPAMDIVGWIEPPTYDKPTHRLIWSLASNDRGAPAGEPQTINYNTYALGREGYISLDMITNSQAIGPDKAIARDLLAKIDFASGKRYTDFNPSTDRVAEYGLAALVGAVAVKKLGLLAIIGAFVLKAWKIALVAMLGGWAAVKRWFGKLFGRNKTEQVAAEPDPAWHGDAGEQEGAAMAPLDASHGEAGQLDPGGAE